MNAKILSAGIAMLFGFTGCNYAQMSSNKVNAPEITTQYGWLNTDKPVSIKDLKGKIVLLDFWTYGCINCQHIIPDLKRLEKEYAKQLVVIGVHSAKFDNEKNTENIRKAILKNGIEHPVVNDADYTVWNAYAVKSWPTVILIDPEGKIVQQESGEGVYFTFKPSIDKLIQQYAGKLNEIPLVFHKEVMTPDVLHFPAKLCADDKGNIYVSDAGHNRIIKISPQGSELAVIGSGIEGLKDGDFLTAQFNGPQGLVYANNTLYVADTRNHAIRKVDFMTKTVKMLWGNGHQEQNWLKTEAREGEALNSPWDVQLDGDLLYIAMAGNHQIWKGDIKTGVAEVLAGSGREALDDGNFRTSAFTQPSGLFLNKGRLYVADAEASAIRTIDLKQEQVKTILGTGLFDFGDVDGPVTKALIQHSSGLCVNGNILYIADTYNGKVKQFDVTTKILTTLVGGLEEPNGVLIVDNTLWITNTNKNQLIKVNLQTKEKKIVSIFPLPKFEKDNAAY